MATYSEIEKLLTSITTDPKFRKLCDEAETAALSVFMSRIVMQDENPASLRDGNTRMMLTKAMASVGKMLGELALLKEQARFHSRAGNPPSRPDVGGTAPLKEEVIFEVKEPEKVAKAMEKGGLKFTVPPGPNRLYRDFMFTILSTCEQQIGETMLLIDLAQRLAGHVERKNVGAMAEVMVEALAKAKAEDDAKARTRAEDEARTQAKRKPPAQGVH